MEWFWIPPMFGPCLGSELQQALISGTAVVAEITQVGLLYRPIEIHVVADCCLPVTPPASNNAPSATGAHQRTVTPSLSQLSLGSVRSEASRAGPGSSSSTKRSLDHPLDGSPQPKRRLAAEAITASFRRSAPCLEPNLRTAAEGGEPRRGLSRRSTAPIRSLFLAPRRGRLSPPVGDPGDVETETFWGKGGGSSTDPFSGPRWPVHPTEHPSASRDEGYVRKRRGRPFWQLTSAPVIGSRRAEEAFDAEALLAGLEAEHAVRLETSQGRSPSEEAVSKGTPADNAEDDTGARLNVPRALEDVREETEDDADNDSAIVNAADETNPLVMCGKRKYSDWIGYFSTFTTQDDGPHTKHPPLDGARRQISGGGALFPEGYQPRLEEPEPWVCPVRDCQVIFPEVWALGGHFSVSRQITETRLRWGTDGGTTTKALHRGALLNDNQDGTMSVIGKRTAPDPVSGRMPPLVVSRRPIDPATAPPKAAPHRPGRRKKVVNRAEGSNAKKRKEPNKTGETQKQPGSLSDAFSPPRPASSRASVQTLNPDDEDRTRDQQPLAPVRLSETSSPEEEVRSNPFLRYRQRELPEPRSLQLLQDGHLSSGKMACAMLVYLTGVQTEPPCHAGVSKGVPQTRFEPIETPARPEPPTTLVQDGAPDNNADKESDTDGDGDGDGDTDLIVSPATTSGSPACRTAVRVQQRLAGRPRMVAIGRASNTESAGGRPGSVRGDGTDAKRRGSIRRLAAKLGAKAVRREAAVRAPREKPVPECGEAGEKRTDGEGRGVGPTAEAEAAPTKANDRSTGGTPGRRRSRRLRELQLQFDSQVEARASKTTGASPASKLGGASPSKVSKLRSRVKNGRGIGGGAKHPTMAESHGVGGRHGGLQGDPGTAPDMPLAPAGWEMAPGRIRLGMGEDAQSEFWLAV
ncbi:hypothetical protein VTJ83DRAFT_5267 [Remersonia thermophila]|uniref:Uncharacterized protein n=1 Tax=Remersonia thermophila TaxID=72144 RepID=A0ABR4D6C3_9PEZI